jgi:hypothetical protein
MDHPAAEPVAARKTVRQLPLVAGKRGALGRDGQSPFTQDPVRPEGEVGAVDPPAVGHHGARDAGEEFVEVPFLFPRIGHGSRR